ncbi:Kelch repeat-containing protein [Stratiformator vulcanicus]|uniref:N-acetylneuraminate epimerase n=1 Tax=Stratiformator vulcanicus TaxID=2527980 RepID=A0A517R345_9PLAN|nr:hypothetical protein [Stratiformator vulcanicus]QDT38306.1 N-acetylneuraminate epimerase [Stratiformator vulcanicus]
MSRSNRFGRAGSPLSALLAGVVLSCSTLAFPEDGGKSEMKLPDLPEGITSFGAAKSGDSIFVYGGNVGEAHSYNLESQTKAFRQLDLTNPDGWHNIPVTGPPLQGLAMVADGEVLYRLGGFNAENQPDEEQDLHSRDFVQAYDRRAMQPGWDDLTPLPEPRSSFDAIVLDGRVYVAGGWSLNGGSETEWHKTAWSADLSKRPLQWESLTEPPFLRRALALAAHDGKIWVMGGMSPEGPSGRVDVYDPRTKNWSLGPEIDGDTQLKGFGVAAFGIESGLYASTMSGNLLRLSDDGSSWELVQELERKRYFHRMLPGGDDKLVLLGGTSMHEGRHTEVDVIEAIRRDSKD